MAKENKLVIITGVSRGMGMATAKKFLGEGWYVVGTSTSGKADIIDKNFEMHQLDLSDQKSIEKFAQNVKKSGAKFDALINSAGVYLDWDTNNEIPIDILRKTLEVNLIGLIDLTERLLGSIKDGGHIINLSSDSGVITDFEGSYAPSYQISKGALNMYTRVLASRLKDRKIIVASIDPGWVKTEMGGPNAKRPPEEPAAEIFELATRDIDSGFFWYMGKKRSW